MFNQKLINDIKAGLVGIMPTDTIFGIIADPFNISAVQKVNRIKSRPQDKRYVLLIGSTDQLSQLNIVLTENQKAVLDQYWPGPNTFVLPTQSNPFSYQTSAQAGLAVRLPDHVEWQDLLMQTGPLIATSANISGQPAATTLNQAQENLPGLDFYLDGPTGTQASQIARLNPDGSLEWIRKN